MPIYEYKCKNCGVFEVTQRITETPLTTCPTCEGDVSRLISLTSFVLKGSGWYVTDYARNGKSGESASKDAGTNDSDETPASTSAETAKSTSSEASKPAAETTTSTKSAE
jgi:putative FmdB family regulatory protein